MNPRAKHLLEIAGLAAAYTLAARLGLAFDPVAGFALLVWPPTGIALAAILLLGPRVWPGVFIGAALSNAFMGGPIGVALGVGLGNTLEALVGAHLVRRAPRYLPSLESVGTAVALIVGAATVSTMISATIGVASLYLALIISDSQVVTAWQAWWIGDLVGALLVAPIILVWRTPSLAAFRHHGGEIAALTIATVAVSVLAFFGDSPPIPTLATAFHQGALLLAVLIWSSLRFGQRGAVTTTFYLAAIALAATSTGHGPFALPDANRGLLTLQTSMAMFAASAMLLGATIAERRAALDRLRASLEEIAKANSAKSDFLAVMSHELRTPLNAIAGFTELLRTGVYGALNPKQVDALERIARSEKDLLVHIDSVLTFVKLEKRELNVHTEEVPVADAFDAVEPTIAPVIRSKHVVVLRQLPGKRIAVHADRKGLEQILASLVSNASKYTGDGGVITLGAERVDGHVRIWVRDTGIGIAPGQIQKVFDPFFQVESGTTRRFSGVGLGLTVARDLARGMNGDLTIASEVGTGTTASVVLPAA